MVGGCMMVVMARLCTDFLDSCSEMGKLRCDLTVRCCWRLRAGRSLSVAVTFVLSWTLQDTYVCWYALLPPPLRCGRCK